MRASDARNAGETNTKKRFGVARRMKRTISDAPRANAPHETLLLDKNALRFAKNVFFIDEKIYVRLRIFSHDTRTTHDRRERVGGEGDR